MAFKQYKPELNQLAISQVLHIKVTNQFNIGSFRASLVAYSKRNRRTYTTRIVGSILWVVRTT
jgi:hypothetical protein